MAESGLKFSLISPTFLREEEVSEFLDSLTGLNYAAFEVILGDGSPENELKGLFETYQNHLPLRVYHRPYLPVSDARNRAAEWSTGEYLIFLDSDCLIPSEYLNQIEAHLSQNPLDLFGGPDKADENFTPLQKAISFSMTHFITTGGIRGGKKTLTSYQPRGFNMGIKRKVFFEVKGYDEQLKCGEDVDLSIRIQKAGYKSGFIPEAAVFHKRRTSLKKYFKQVYRFGAARIDLAKRHQNQMRAAHVFPFAFAFGLIFSILMLPVTRWFFLMYAMYFLAVGVFARIETKSTGIALLSVLSTATMFLGYAYGFAQNAISHLVFKKALKL